MSGNNNTTNNSAPVGVGFSGLLALAFIILKLCHVIEWSWWWVLSPIWISFGIVILVVVSVLIWSFISDKKNVSRRKR